MKFLNNEDYNALKAKAEGFDKLVNTVVENGENIKAEDVTAETIIEALQREETPADSSDLQKTIDTLTAEKADLQTKLSAANQKATDLQSQLDELDTEPAETETNIVSKGEQSGAEMDIAKFADANKGDTNAIIAKMKEEGIL